MTAPAAPLGDALRRFTRSTSVYALGTLAVRGYTVLLVPVYLAVLTPRDFGVLALTEVVTVPLVSVLGLCLDRAVTRFYHAWPAAERPRYLGAIWLGTLATTAAVTLLLLAAGPWLFARLITAVPFDPYLRLACLIASAKSLSLTPLMILRAREEAGRYVLAGAGGAVTGSAAILWLLLVERQGVAGVLLGTLINEAAWGAGWLVFMARRSRLTVAWRYFQEPLRYSLPLIPAEFLYSLAHAFDRFVLEKLIPLPELGLYAVGARVGRLFHEANQAAKNAWLPLALRLGVEGGVGAGPVIRSLGRAYVAVFAVGAVALALFAPELVVLFGGPAYREAGAWAPWFVAAYFGYVCYFVALPGINLSSRSEFVTVVTSLYATVSVGGTLLLAPHLGAAGALAALGGGIYTMAATAAWASRRLSGLALPGWESVAVVAGGAVVLAAQAVTTGAAYQAEVKVLLLLVFGAAVVTYALRIVTPAARLAARTP